ncbi:MAG TPA: copper chaperone PCu(A)C [Alphaproteobacteria bacterium]|nr:copper chaperone PCu(A)C [Alphaproteobacteria bacterium]
MFGFPKGALSGLLLAFSVSITAHAAGSAIDVADASARPTPPSATTAAIYLNITNNGTDDDALIGIATPVAQKAELHSTTNDHGIMKMSAVAEQPVKAGEKLEIKPGGLHIMLTGLKRPLKAGDQFLLTLTFRKAGQVETTVAVQAPAKVNGKADHMPDMPGMKM